MGRHVEAWMDGEALSAQGPFTLQQVREDVPTVDVDGEARPGRDGQRMIRKRRTKLSVALTVMIHEVHDLQARVRYTERLARWAQGRVLELSSRPERRLHVCCTGEPALGDARNYAEEVRVEFTAYEVPYWEDKYPATLSLSGSEASGRLYVPGTVPAPVCAAIRPAAGTLTSLTLEAGTRRIELMGMSIASGQELRFERDAYDVLAIRCGGVSQLSHRSAASDDDLFVEPGRADVRLTANVACKATVTARGRWA